MTFEAPGEILGPIILSFSGRCLRSVHGGGTAGVLEESRGNPILPHLYSCQSSGFLPVPQREGWRLPGTQGPSRSLRPSPVGSSGLSLGINSLTLEGWGRKEEALLCCLQNKRQQTNPGNNLSISSRDSEALLSPQAGSSQALRAETHSLPGWGS